MSTKVSIKEKIGYGLGDAAANIGWRGVGTFLFIFYTDVFGLDPVTVGVLFLTARFSDGISDILMGVIGDRTKSKYGKKSSIVWFLFDPKACINLKPTAQPHNSSNGYLQSVLFGFKMAVAFGSSTPGL